MTKNPLVNALAASIYISIIAFVMDYATRIAPHTKSVVVPITVVSLFTLSAAVMGYLFLYQPGQLYFDGKKKQAVNLFLQTVGVFAVITSIFLFLLFSRLL